MRAARHIYIHGNGPFSCLYEIPRDSGPELLFVSGTAGAARIYKIVANSIKCNDDTHGAHSHTYVRRHGHESLLMIAPTTAAGYNNSNNNNDNNIDTLCSGPRESVADKRFGAETKRGDWSVGGPRRHRCRLNYEATIDSIASSCKV